MAAERQYDLLLLGATGYTGKLTAEYITTSTRTNVKWAIAGRSGAKLDALVTQLKALNGAREAPDVITVSELNLTEATKLARKTRVLLNTVGPYFKFSTPVVQACAESGTHYLDVTGETPWVREVLDKYEETAKKNKSIIIPSIGVESAPSDLLAYTAVKLVREVWDCGVMDMVASIHELRTTGASGGTLATGLGLLDHYSARTIRDCLNPFCLSPIRSRDHRHTKYPDPTTYAKTRLQKLTGVWEFPLLGTLTTSITATPNQAIVSRSAGRNPYFYGFNFTYEEYMAVNSALVGFLIHAALSLMAILLVFPPIRMIAKAMVSYKPGSGPSPDSSKNDRLELRGVALAEQLSRTPRKALSTFTFEGGLYHLTAILLAEGAFSLLDTRDKVAKKHGFGFLTPACLEDDYVKRLDGAGVKIHVQRVGDVGSK